MARPHASTPRVLPEVTSFDPLSVRGNWRLWLNGAFRTVFPKKRELHVYVLGTSKSGTHSLAGIFANFRSMHEPSAIQLAHLTIEARKRPISARSLRRWLKWRDRSMQLDVESNYFLAPFVETLVPLFGEAKFVVPFRHPRRWLRSWVDHTINRREKAGSIFDRVLYALYRPQEYEYRAEAPIFEPLDLFPLDAYLDYWARCNRRLLAFVPPDRSLWLKTEEISRSLDSLASFAGTEVDRLDSEQTHLFKGATKHDVLQRVDQDFLEDTIESRCRGVWNELLARRRNSTRG